jgi:cell division protein FtsB
MDDVTFGQVLNFSTLVIVPIVLSVMGLWVKQVQEKSNADILVLQGQVAYLTEQLDSRDATIKAQAIKIESLQDQITNLLMSQARARRQF